MSQQRRVAEFTTKDAIFLSRAIKHSEAIGKIDFEKVAADMGLKNASTASARFGQIKRKLNELPFTPATIAAVQNSSPPVGTISGASATKGNKRKAPGLPGSAPKRARKSTTKTKPVKTTTNIKYEDDQEESSETNMGCSTGGRIAEDIDSAEESTEQGVKDIAGDEMEEEEKLAESAIDPLHLLKQEMKNEDVAAAAQDYEY